MLARWLEDNWPLVTRASHSAPSGKAWRSASARCGTPSRTWSGMRSRTETSSGRPVTCTRCRTQLHQQRPPVIPPGVCGPEDEGRPTAVPPDPGGRPCRLDRCVTRRCSLVALRYPGTGKYMPGLCVVVLAKVEVPGGWLAEAEGRPVDHDRRHRSRDPQHQLDRYEAERSPFHPWDASDVVVAGG